MLSLDLETVRRSLALARARGLARMDLSVGGAFLSATFSPDWEAAAEAPASEAAGEEGPPTFLVVAPVVGYFRPSGLAVGDEVSEGQPVGEVVALGISNEVGSPADGVFDGLLAEDGAAVEYGQGLARIVGK